jgi:predicted DNA-binding transcriptional regulator AlpA
VQVTIARKATQVQPQLLTRHEVVAVAGVTYPTIWLWMREGKFPRSRIVGGKSMWLASEIEAWIAALPVRPLKPLDDEAA